MIIDYNGRSYDIPSRELNRQECSAIVKTSNGIVTEEDITRADETALPTWPGDRIELQRLRLYFQLNDGMLVKDSPIGVRSRHLWSTWLYVFIDPSVLKKMDDEKHLELFHESVNPGATQERKRQIKKELLLYGQSNRRD